MKTDFEEIRNLIQQNKSEEAIKSIYNAIGTGSTSKINSINKIELNLFKLKSNIRKGVISNEDFFLEKARINYSLLDCVESLERSVYNQYFKGLKSITIALGIIVFIMYFLPIIGLEKNWFSHFVLFERSFTLNKNFLPENQYVSNVLYFPSLVFISSFLFIILYLIDERLENILISSMLMIFSAFLFGVQIRLLYLFFESHNFFVSFGFLAFSYPVLILIYSFSLFFDYKSIRTN